MSLRTRVGIAAAVQALGYQECWKRIFDELFLTKDDVFTASLKARDRKKKQKGTKQKSKKGKIARRKVFLTKFAESHKEQMDDAKTGKTYGSGVALKAAKKNATDKLPAAMRNPEGTPKHLQRCAYYAYYWSE